MANGYGTPGGQWGPVQTPLGVRRPATPGGQWGPWRTPITPMASLSPEQLQSYVGLGGPPIGTGSPAGGILDALRQRFRQVTGAGAPVRPFTPAPGIGAGMYGEPAVPVTPAAPQMGGEWGRALQARFAPTPAPPAPTPAAQEFPPAAAPYPTREMAEGLYQGPAAPGAVSPEYVGRGQVSDKMAPQSPISFAWGGGTPQPYTPGQTEILEMRGAPAARQGFMGAQPVAGGGGFAMPDVDWTKRETWEERVANPMGFERYRQQLPEWQAQEAAQREQEQALAIERERGTQAIRLAQEQAEAQLRILNEQIQAQAEAIRTEAERLMAAEEQRLGRPLTPEEEMQQWFTARMMMGQGLLGR